MPDRRRPRVLLIDDDDTFRRLVSQGIADEGFDVDTAGDGFDGLRMMSRRAYDLALVDLRMPRMDGLSLLSEMQRRHPSVVPVVLTGFGSVPSAVEATKLGAFDVVSKTTSIEGVTATLRRALGARVSSREGTVLGEALLDHEAFCGIVGRSECMMAVFELIEILAHDDHPVLVLGESGTGKELVARALHARGERRNAPFIATNCASLKESFVESELFGHVRGAFTGAVAAKDGLFQLANGGVLLVDEIGEMPESSQTALLRVIETHTFRPLGATREQKVDVRIVAATNRALDVAVQEGRFRADLFYRLCVGKIDLPPLRDRRACIPLLVNHFLDSSANARRRGTSLSQAAIDALCAHPWPGNVRELFNTLERAVLTAKDRRIEPSNLGLGLVGPVPHTEDPASVATRQARGDLTLAEHERSYIESLLEREAGNVSKVARILGVDATTVRRKIRSWKG